jgi:DNA polymerase III psi subunit
MPYLQGIGNLPLNQPVQGKKTHVLYSFSFDEMMSSNDNKKAFWEQMKTL